MSVRTLRRECEIVFCFRTKIYSEIVNIVFLMMQLYVWIVLTTLNFNFERRFNG